MSYQEDIIEHFTMNRPQTLALTVMANETYALYGRGSGKTQGVICPWILHKVHKMPRSSGVLIGTSFADLETKILKGIFTAFSAMGLQEGKDFMYGKRPPESWKKPYIPVISYTHTVSFPNGTTMDLVSLEKIGSANSLSAQWAVADETKYLKEEKLNTEVFPILRGNEKIFGNSCWYGAKLLVSDKFHPDIHWLLAKRKLVDHQVVKIVLYYQSLVNDLMVMMSDATEAVAKKIQTRINKLERVLNSLRMNLTYVSEASALENIENLKPSFFKNRKKDSTTYQYKVQILNEDPVKAEKSFYPDRAEVHLHDEEYDDDVTKPIGVVLDYQWSISPLVSFQVSDKVTGALTLNFIANYYALFPQGLKHVVDRFCEENKYRPCKEVYYFYDHTAIGKKAGHKSFSEEVQEYFINNGWICQMYYVGDAPDHEDKYRRIQHYLSNTESIPYPIRIHRHRCAAMVLAMDMTGTITVSGVTKKDKTKEKDHRFPQEQATHIPDCFDQAVWSTLELDKYPHIQNIGTLVGVR